MSSYTLSVEHQPAIHDIQALQRSLRAYNLSRVPALGSLTHRSIAAVAYADDGTLVGGAIGEENWGWLYVDTLWVDAAYRGQEYGSRIMILLEQAGRVNGLSGAFLMTADFQARGFYEKLGYRVVGACPNRPAGHTTYYLLKPALSPAPIDPRLHLQIPPDPAALWTLDSALRASSAVPIVNQRFTIFIRDAAQTIVGGLVGGFFWDWFDLHYLWVADYLRGQGYGSQMLALLDAECARRGSWGIIGDTASFQALPFYQKHGYRVLFTLPDRPPGHESYYFYRVLRA